MRQHINLFEENRFDEPYNPAKTIFLEKIANPKGSSFFDLARTWFPEIKGDAQRKLVMDARKIWMEWLNTRAIIRRRQNQRAEYQNIDRQEDNE